MEQMWCGMTFAGGSDESGAAVEAIEVGESESSNEEEESSDEWEGSATRVIVVRDRRTVAAEYG